MSLIMADDLEPFMGTIVVVLGDYFILLLAYLTHHIKFTTHSTI
jgi:hypothetical protein